MTEDMTARIKAALAQLDHDDDNQWTDDRLPRTGVVQKIARDMTITRRDVSAAMPGFVRQVVEPAVEPLIEAMDTSVDEPPSKSLENFGPPREFEAAQSGHSEPDATPRVDLFDDRGDFIVQPESVTSGFTEGELRAYIDIFQADNKLRETAIALDDAINTQAAAADTLRAADAIVAETVPPVTAVSAARQFIEATRGQ